MRNYQRRVRQKRMFKLRSFLQMCTVICFLSALAVTVALFIGVIRPASAQLFNFGGPPQRPQRLGASSSGSGWFDKDLFMPFRPQARQHRSVHRAPVRLAVHEDVPDPAVAQPSPDSPMMKCVRSCSSWSGSVVVTAAPGSTSSWRYAAMACAWLKQCFVAQILDDVVKLPQLPFIDGNIIFKHGNSVSFCRSW